MDSWAAILMVFGIVWLFATPVYCFRLADSKGYDAAWWFVGGLFLQLIALLAIGFMPEREDYDYDEDYRVAAFNPRYPA